MKNKEIKVIFDTNVWISFLIDGLTPAEFEKVLKKEYTNR